MYQAAKLVTGNEEVLSTAPAKNETANNTVIEAAQQLVQKGLAFLNGRERDVVVWHYGLKNNNPMTLEQIGKVFGVTKERVRQIERKAFGKIRAALEAQPDLAPQETLA
jgi:RNA polymerase primary sigma factor